MKFCARGNEVEMHNQIIFRELQYSQSLARFYLSPDLTVQRITLHGQRRILLDGLPAQDFL